MPHSNHESCQHAFKGILVSPRGKIWFANECLLLETVVHFVTCWDGSMRKNTHLSLNREKTYLNTLVEL